MCGSILNGRGDTRLNGLVLENLRREENTEIELPLGCLTGDFALVFSGEGRSLLIRGLFQVGAAVTNASLRCWVYC